MDAIRTTALNLSRRRQRVLHDIDLSVNAGECFTLVGANGAGKTTLIKALLDLVGLQSGRIELFGVDHRDRRARAELAYLPERFHPAHYQTGEQFLRTMLDLHGLRYQREAALTCAEQLDLDPNVLDKPSRRYSKGMTQKLGLIYALLSERQLLVLDEPLSGLDPKARHAVLGQLQAARAAGRTLFVSTHLLNDVEALCDRIGILHRGQLLFCGSPRECRDTFNGEHLEQAYLNCIAATEA